MNFRIRSPIFRLFLGAAVLWPATPSPLPAEAGEPGGGPGRMPVFGVDAGAGAGSGFLIDSSGIVLTAAKLIGPTEHIRVIVAPDRIHSARLLLVDETAGTAFLRVHPGAVGGLAPLGIPPGKVRDLLPEKGDRVLALGYSPGHPSTRGTVIRKSYNTRVCFEARADPNPLGGPLLNADREVIGIDTGESRLGRKDVLHCGVPIHRAVRSLPGARERMEAIGLPLAQTLTEPSGAVYPAHLAARAGPEGTRAGSLYRIRAGKVDLEFLTPPVLDLLGRHPPEHDSRKGNFYRWERHRGSHEPVVIVQAVPDLRLSGGTPWRFAGAVVANPLIVAGYILVVIVAVIENTDPGIPPPLYSPNRAYRLKRDFSGMQLLRDGMEIVPLESRRACDTARVPVKRKPGKDPRKRKVRGCYGIYKYPPEAFRPGGVLEVRTFEGGKPVEPDAVRLGEELAGRIWADFRPYFDALRKEGSGNAHAEPEETVPEQDPTF